MRRHCWVIVLAGMLSYFNPERALGAPQREVSQSRAASLSSPPYVVILISCSGLVSFVLLLFTCLCCKKGGVGFNEFDNAEGEECSGGSSPAQEDSLSSCPSLPEVYTLPLRDRANCLALQDGSDSKSKYFHRHTLNYLQEIGNGWFGKVILAEVLCDCSSSQAVVKELRVSASPLEQRKFLAESEPYRTASSQGMDSTRCQKLSTCWPMLTPMLPTVVSSWLDFPLGGGPFLIHTGNC
ncbi:serine/threonine-protein kinase LMTK3-like isoform X2 [Oncorhynchus keta]|uniref:serine/threonine-protein kinase LMTK3-like isoform X2 n=1 Tax=Oncorhynchus keta TaxID=8018 RepID=UPI00227C4671|nr:serine/threonine-protein kinase LMTK3-like isoform X2 [Oncorhynchus keta]